MRGSLYLAGRYLLAHPVTTGVLVASITLILFLPLGLRVVVAQSEAQLTARAEATPLLIGAKGSPLELVLNTLYFTAEVPERFAFGEVERVLATGWAQPIPVYARFRARRQPIVGTTLDYFDVRGLRIASGSWFSRLGDCVLGARAAERLEAGPGDTVASSPETSFDFAGVYPLRMRVSGVLAFAESADDDAVFVDLKTAWVIEGLAHGHQDLGRPDAASAVLEREEGNVVANASVRQFEEITDENVESFHFHGDVSGFPLTAVLVYPRDHKAETLLRGRYESADERQQIVRPREVLDDLLGTILTVQRFVVAAFAILALATLGTATLVFFLSIRLRRREIETMSRIGGARSCIAALLAFEIAAVFLAGALFAILLTFLTARLAPYFIRFLL